MKNKNIILFLLFLTLTTGFFLRTYQLGEEDLWKDEAYGLYVAQKENTLEVLKTAVISNIAHPPLGHIMFHWWLKISGTNEAGLRFFSAILGTLNILLIFLIGKELVNSQMGLIAAFLMTLSRIQIIFSQEARQYSVLTTFALLSLFYWIRFIKTNKIKDLILNLLFSILMLYTHFLSAALIAIQNMFSIVFCKKIKKWFLSQLILGIFLIPWAVLFYKGVKYELDAFPSLMLKRGFPALVSNELFVFIIAPIFLVAVLFLFTFILKKNLIKLKDLNLWLKDNQFFTISLAIFILATYLLIGFNITEPRGIFKYGFFLIPLIYLINAHFINLIKSRKIKYVLLILVFILSLFSAADFYKVQTKDKMSEIADFIKSNQQPNDLIIYSGDLTGLALTYYYKGSSVIVAGAYGTEFRENFAVDNPTTEILEESEERIRKLIKGKKGVWVLYQSDYANKLQKLIEQDLRDLLEKSLEKDYLTIKLVNYKVKESK